MKKILKKILIIIVLCFCAVLVTNTILTFSNNINDYLSLDNRANLESITSIGDLVHDKDIESLEDSKITFEDVTIDTNIYPYYGLLSSDEQTLYKQVYANIKSLSTTFIPVTTIKIESASKVIEAVYNDHPEFFWLDNSYSYKYTTGGNCAQIILSFNETAADFSNAKSLFDESAKVIIDGALNLSTDYEKEKYVHDTLIELVTYDTSSNMNQSAYSALVGKSSVCAGYARAFQYIMITLGIPTYYVTGYAGGDHAWNIVLLGDEFYNVDVTWDDTEGYQYDYFNASDAIFSKTHTRVGLSTSLPKCLGTTYSGLENSTHTLNNEEINDEVLIEEDNQEKTEDDIEEEPIIDEYDLQESEEFTHEERQHNEDKRRMR